MTAAPGAPPGGCAACRAAAHSPPVSPYCSTCAGQFSSASAVIPAISRTGNASAGGFPPRKGDHLARRRQAQGCPRTAPSSSASMRPANFISFIVPSPASLSIVPSFPRAAFRRFSRLYHTRPARAISRCSVLFRLFCFVLICSLFFPEKEKRTRKKAGNPLGLARCARPSAARAFICKKIFCGAFQRKAPQEKTESVCRGAARPIVFRASPSPIRFLFFGSFFSFSERKERTDKKRKEK